MASFLKLIFAFVIMIWSSTASRSDSELKNDAQKIIDDHFKHNEDGRTWQVVFFSNFHSMAKHIFVYIFMQDQRARKEFLHPICVPG